ncbi:MAG TPA: DUF4913 domain-containing protein [Sporichthyaceae bacterium]|nr:DUF4913 domain-containing protein [Sporichthyaceae bacterium]
MTDRHDEGLFTPDGADLAWPRFADVHAFVADYLAKMWARTIRDPDNTFRWCAKWWDHPLALDRLTALWRAHEAMHAQDGADASSWWTDHADPTRKALCAPDGPFTRCGPGRHQVPPELPIATPLLLGTSAVA